jgi:hypothetical protein
MAQQTAQPLITHQVIGVHQRARVSDRLPEKRLMGVKQQHHPPEPAPFPHGGTQVSGEQAGHVLDQVRLRWQRQDLLCIRAGQPPLHPPPSEYVIQPPVQRVKQSLAHPYQLHR